MSPFITGELARIHAEELMLEPVRRQQRLESRRRRQQQPVLRIRWWTRRRQAPPVVEPRLPGIPLPSDTIGHDGQAGFTGSGDHMISAGGTADAVENGNAVLV